MRLDTLRAIYREHGPRSMVTVLRYLGVRAWTLALGRGVACVVCGWSGRAFLPSVLYEYRAVRAGAVCPQCASLERHRACALFYRQFFPAEFGGERVDILHFAPEPGLVSLLQGMASRYRTSDYENPSPGQLKLDLHDLRLPADSVQVAILNYVLCCTPNHRLAVENLLRVIRPGGVVLAVEVVREGVPLDEWGKKGQVAMYRTYGTLDLEAQFAPFAVECRNITGDIPPSEVRRLGLKQPQFMLILRKHA